MVRVVQGLFPLGFSLVDQRTKCCLILSVIDHMMLKRTAYRVRSRACSADLRERILFVRAAGQRVYDAAIASQNDLAKNTLMKSSCSHKWWETIMNSTFGVQHSIPVQRGPVDGLVGDYCP